MVHIVASFAFSMIALGALSLILWMLAEAAPDIRRALGMAEAAPRAMARRSVRIRPAVRWQTPATSAQRLRAA